MNSARTICEMGGRLACNTLRDLRTNAFIALGTKVLVNGFKLAEVTKIAIGRQIEIEANYIPNDPAQSIVLDAITEVGIVKIQIALPDGWKTILEQEQAIVSGGVDLSVIREAVKLKFSFPAAGIRRIATRPALGPVKPLSPPNQGIGGKPGHLKFNGVYWECGLIPWCEHRSKFAAFLHRLLFPFWDTSECRH